MNEFSFIIFLPQKTLKILNLSFYSDTAELNNRAFLYGDAVRVSFFVHQSRIILAEECYFFLMASMRKMRMAIPLSYTLEFFVELFTENVIEKGVSEGVINFQVYRNSQENLLSKREISFYFEVEAPRNILEMQRAFEIDLIKEISVNTNVLSGIHVHSPENIYAEVYAADNELDDVILLNPNKRIARTVIGNLLFLSGNTIKIPKQSEGAFVSPLMESFVTFVHQNKLAVIEEAELIAFESQKAEEIMIVSDEKGIFPVMKIRNKTFEKTRFTEMVSAWSQSFA